ncbi:MAG: hypothetical protein KDB21_14710 [Acidimicrobiales bacterium]|nr:hypothetical protein [Acidimicrobiales bacterium]
MRRRIIGLLAALLLAGFGTFVLVGYVQGASERASAGQELVNVLVVTSPVAAGTPASELASSVELRQIPLESKAVGAVVDLAELGEYVTSIDLVPGEQLVSARFVDSATVEPEREGVPVPVVEVPEGMVEVSFSIEPERMLGGLLAPGDHVMVVGSFDSALLDTENGATIQVDGSVFVLPEDVTESGSDQEIQPGRVTATRVVLQSALITRIQADTVPDLASGEGEESPSSTLLVPSGNFNVTIAVSPLDLEKIVFTMEYGTVWLAYQPGDSVGGSTPGQTFDSILRGDLTSGASEDGNATDDASEDEDPAADSDPADDNADTTDTAAQADETDPSVAGAGDGPAFQLPELPGGTDDTSGGN